MRNSRGMTFVDVAAVLVCTCALGPTLFPFLEKGRQTAQREQDALQLGSITDAMNIYALGANGSYPRPSQIDLANATVRSVPFSKDNTGNIFSILIFNGFVSPQQMVSPAESATATVIVDRLYEYEDPQRAAIPEQALWDPGFAGTPVDFSSQRRFPSISNQSYAHIMPFGRRLDQWRTRSDRLIPIVANRGPQYASNDSAPYPAGTGGRWRLLSGPTGVFSNTLLIHGPRTSWEGHVAYNDGRVEFWLGPTSTRNTYERAAGSPRIVRDNIFVNESDEAFGDNPGGVSNGTNIYMRPVAAVSGNSSAISVITWRD